VREDRIREGDEDGEAQLQQFLTSKATIQQVRDSAADLQQATSRKYSSKKIGDKEIISQKWIDNIMGNIGNAIAIGDALLHATPESVGMAWFCVKLGLNAMESNHQLYSLFGSGLTSMTEIMILIPHHSQLYDERQKPEFESNELIEKLFRDVVDVYFAVMDFLFAIKRHVEARTLATMRHGEYQEQSSSDSLPPCHRLTCFVLDSIQGHLRRRSSQILQKAGKHCPKLSKIATAPSNTGCSISSAMCSAPSR
jgi:hypothetical protein